ncbi:hypothetical protein L198_02861 [Cryptococcus wingfieldii CBS 7118]|uniref:Uncharacterized protein n=1 Tax=Cryptococcus wingfieldii CBS 7118 TaxID=1295528 RepID=A0A1E3JKS5_9TREE|nr:hypothetical protein L198_02861 [Cryptococcus wingfieldii CBS 7118]ODO00542.1 hypothetical protein L198_02861 [Cryptococcus wingfieldii CBS 7118]
MWNGCLSVRGGRQALSVPDLPSLIIPRLFLPHPLSSFTPLLLKFTQVAKLYTSIRKGKQVDKYCGERGYGARVSMARRSLVKLVGLSVRSIDILRHLLPFYFRFRSVTGLVGEDNDGEVTSLARHKPFLSPGGRACRASPPIIVNKGPAVALFPNLEWLIISKSVYGPFRTKAYTALLGIRELKAPRLCVTESYSNDSPSVIGTGYHCADHAHQLKELSVHDANGQSIGRMSMNRSILMNVAFRIPWMKDTNQEEEMDENGGEDVYDSDADDETKNDVCFERRLKDLRNSETFKEGS